MALQRVYPPCRHWECLNLRTCRYASHGPSCTCADCNLRHQTNLNAGLRCPHGSCFWCETERKLHEHHRNGGCTCSQCYSRHARAKECVEVCPVESCVWCEEDHEMRKDGMATCVCQKCWRRHERALEDGVDCAVTNCAFCDVDDSLNGDDDYEEDFWIRSASINDDTYHSDRNWSRYMSSSGSYSSGSSMHDSIDRGHYRRDYTYYPCCGRFGKSKRCRRHQHYEQGTRIYEEPKTAHRRY